jgi:Glycosyltransferase family 28 C-terminal domain
MNVLIVSWDGGGNTTPAYNLGARLVQRGHHVTLLGWPLQALRAAASGLEFLAFTGMPPWPEGLMFEEGWEIAGRWEDDPATVDEIIDVARSIETDVLVIDCMLGPAFAAADRLGLPTVALTHVLYREFVDVWGDANMQTSAGALLEQVDLVLALTAPGFDRESAELPDNVAYVGPILPPDPGPALDMFGEPGDPWVLVSLSTTEQRQRLALPAILEAVGGLPIRVLLTLGGVLPVDSVDVPPNVVARGYVEHTQVLPYVSAVVCHGGLSTITGALAYGVPLVCIPQGREQPLNAERVEACGVGLVVPADASSAMIAEAVRSVVGEPAFRAAAGRFRSPDSGATAARLVENLSQRMGKAMSQTSSSGPAAMKSVK